MSLRLLFLSNICLCILKANRVVHLRRSEFQENEMNNDNGLVRQLNDFFVNEIFRWFRILREGHCEDRSLKSFQSEPKTCERDSHDAFRFGKDDPNYLEPKVHLSLFYKLIIAPVADLLGSSEIIVVYLIALYTTFHLPHYRMKMGNIYQRLLESG